MSQLEVPKSITSLHNILIYRTEPTTKSGKTEKLKKVKKTDMLLRSIAKQSGESVESVHHVSMVYSWSVGL